MRPSESQPETRSPAHMNATRSIAESGKRRHRCAPAHARCTSLFTATCLPRAHGVDLETCGELGTLSMFAIRIFVTRVHQHSATRSDSVTRSRLPRRSRSAADRAPSAAPSQLRAPVTRHPPRVTESQARRWLWPGPTLTWRRVSVHASCGLYAVDPGSIELRKIELIISTNSPWSHMHS